MKKRKQTYAKVPKHFVGAIIGAATTVMGAIKERKEKKRAETFARNQRTGVMLQEDTGIYEDYPVSGEEEIRGFYKNGGKMGKGMRHGRMFAKPMKGKCKRKSKGGEINPTELKNGMKEEMEHTKSKRVARRISKDHLEEDAKYYTKLKKAGLAEEYAGGGNIKLVGYNAKGGDLLPLSDDMDLVKGNRHEESTIDNTNGVKLMDATGQPVAEVEDEEVIKDDKKVYSDRLRIGGKKSRTYAQEAERIGKMVGKADSVLAIPDISFRKKNSAMIQKQNWEKAADDLFEHQEEMKRKKGIKDTDTGANIPKGKNGMNMGDYYSKNYPTATAKTGSGFNMNSVVPYLDNVANAVLTATTPRASFPQLARQRKLKTKLNVNSRIQEVTDTVNQVSQGISRGTANSNTAQGRTTAVRLAGMKEKGKIFANKENIETQLENQNTMNQQQTEGQNLARINKYQDSVQARSMNIQGRISANVSDAVEDSRTQKQEQYIRDYQDEQLQVIRDTYDTYGGGLESDLNNKTEIDRLINDPVYRESRGKQYLATNAEGKYIRPKEAQLYLNLIQNIPQ